MRPPNPALDRAIADAETMFAALGTAQRKARDATAERFDPARHNLVMLLSLYAASTREFPQHTAFHRERARQAIADYRVLTGRARRSDRAMRRAA